MFRIKRQVQQPFVRYCTISVTKEVREALTKPLTRVKEETKGQSMDFAEMSEASRTAMQSLQEALKRNPVDSDKFKGKATTLSAGLKAYNTRLANIQNESRSIQSEVDNLLKMLWGGEVSAASATTTPVEEDAAADTPSDFDAEQPILSKNIDRLNNSGKKPIEAEVVNEKSSKSSEVKAEEIEVETLEVEVESTADSMSVPEITAILHEKCIDFSDCLDARSLRARYQEVLDGKFDKPKPEKPRQQTPTSQPSTPRKPDQYNSQNQNGHGGPNNTTETNVVPDANPNAERIMVDGSKLVGEVKMDICLQKNVPFEQCALWCGGVQLADNKRIGDYSIAQSYPIEIRHKDDRPT